jgi:hypothetical protein
VSLGAAYPPVNAGTLATSFTACDSEGDSICQVTATGPTRLGCALELWFGRLGAAPTASACVVASGPVHNVSLAAIKFMRGGSVDAQIGVAVAFDNGAGTVFGATACASASADVSDSDVRVNDPDCFGVVRPTTLLPRELWRYEVGTNMSLALYAGREPRVRLSTRPSGGPEGGDAVGALVVISGSHCANNEADNKRSDVALCDVPPPIDGRGAYLSYHAGALQGLTALLLGGEQLWRSSVTGGAGACSGIVSTGMFSQGDAAAPALIATSRGLEALAVIEGAAGTAGAAAADPRHCGADVAAPDDVLVVSWPLAQEFF